jgi:hypothetical protein
MTAVIEFSKTGGGSSAFGETSPMLPWKGSSLTS